MENVRKRITMELVTTSKKAHRYMIKPNFKDRTIYSNNVMTIHMENLKIKFDKLIMLELPF